MQALIGAIKKFGGGVYVTMVTKMNFSNFAGGKLVISIFASPATDG